MDFYRYDAQVGVHVVDCSGRVDLELGVARLRALELELGSRPAAEQRKLLIDFRATIWASEDVHRELSVITRSTLLHPGNRDVRAAILNERWAGPVSENEHWFLTEAEAREWLQRP